MASDQTRTRLPTPVAQDKEAVASLFADPAPGTQVGPYRLIRLLGSGGMGVVYEAEQLRPKRSVALKVMRAGFSAEFAVRRFEFEAHILGHLHHPGIAQVYEAGVAPTDKGPQPFFAMELIQGRPLTRYANECGLSRNQRLQLMAGICDAVHHAHQRGVIHRDLKPSNILVDELGQPKILDFGVARATDCDLQITTIQTQTGQLVGTLQYMSPEQISADSSQLDTRSDVFALGVILYELLSGSPPIPIRGKQIHEAARAICEEEPTSLGSINRACRGDVETIVAKALEKDKGRRYQSAAELATDLRRFLHNEPISARPPSAVYQLRKFARRNRALVAGVLAAFAALLGGMILTTWQYVLAERARAEAAKRAEELDLVAAFQEQQLAGIKAPLFGETLRNGVIARAREAAAWKQLSEQEVAERMANVEAALDGADFTGLALEALDQHIFRRAIDAVDQQFPEQPLVRARLHQTLGDTLRELGLVQQATEPQEKALALRREHLGNDHEDTVYTINSMARLQSAQGNLETAVTYYQEAYDLAQAVLGPDHPGTMTCLDNLTAVLRKQGKYADTEALVREVYERRRRVLGPDAPDTFVSMNNLGLLLQETGRFEEAGALHREALDGRTKVFGADHQETLVSVNNLGFVLRRLGKLDESEALFRRALDARRRVLGDDHSDTILSYNNLGSILSLHGKHEEAAQHFRQAFESARRVLGPEHNRTVQWASNYAGSLNRLGRYEESVSILREFEPVARRVWVQGNDWLLGLFLARLGASLAGLDQYVPAEALLLDGYARTITRGERNEHTLEVVRQLAEFYEGWAEAHPGGEAKKKADHWRSILSATK